MNRKMMIGASYDSYSNTNGIQYTYHLFWGLTASMWSSVGWMSSMRFIDTLGRTLDQPYPLASGQNSACWRRVKSTRRVVDCQGRLHSTMVTKDVILYWGTEFHCWWVYNVSGNPQRNYIGEIWAQVYLPSQKTHSGADRITIGDVTLEHWPMVNILGDHFTKPLQGYLMSNSHSKGSLMIWGSWICAD